MIHQQPKTQTYLTIFFWMGGWFAFMYVLVHMVTRQIYPHFAYMSIILRLFEVDSSKGAPPKDPLAVERQTPQDLLLAA